MAPRPYSDRSVLPRDSSSSSVSVESDVAQMTVDLSPGSTSEATTPSPTEHLLLNDINANISEILEEECDVLHSNPAFYPTPADSMPFDHAFPDFIRQLTNERNLANVHSLRLRVISRLVSLQRVSLFTTNLRELDLEGSILGSLRDIGCNLKHLQVLKVGNCKLDSLDGTFGLTSLRRLYAQRNMITDVSPCSNLPHIQHIDLTYNRIRNVGYVGFLSVCRKLKTILFTGNPATHSTDYRDHVKRLLPQLQSLDDVPYGEDEKWLQQDELEDFCGTSEEDQNDFYCNTFEEEDLRSPSGCTRRDSLENASSSLDVETIETQKIQKFDNKGFQAKDSHLLSLRKEPDENKQFTVSKCGRSVNVKYEEMEDIQNRFVANCGQSGNSYDSFTLPPLSINEIKKIIQPEKEIVPQGSKVRSEKPKSRNREGAASFLSGSDSEEVDNMDFETMGARPRSLVKFDILSPPTKGNNLSHTTDVERDEEKKKPNTADSCTMFNESEELDFKFKKRSGHTSLTSGRPVCGNLAVALRNRKKKQELENDDFFKAEKN